MSIRPFAALPAAFMILAALSSASAANAIAANAIDGTYVDSGGYVEISVRACGQSRCGAVTRIIRNKPGESNRDAHNNDPRLRNRPILGINVLTNLRWEKGAWRGEVYNPEDGGTYRAVVRPRANGSLEVQGCVSIICRTRIWPSA